MIYLITACLLKHPCLPPIEHLEGRVFVWLVDHLTWQQCFAGSLKPALPATVGLSTQVPLHGGPWYCVRKDSRMNTVYVSRQYFSADKTRDTFR